MNDASGFTPVPPQAEISIPIVTPADIAADTALPLGGGVTGGAESGSSSGSSSAGSFVTGLLSRGTLQSVLGTLSPSVNERMQAFRQTQQKAMQPWREFFGSRDPRAAFGVGHPQYVVPRLRSNFARYRWNYVALCGATVALLALFSFTFFVLALAVLALWAYVFFWRAEPVAVAGVTLSRAGHRRARAPHRARQLRRPRQQALCHRRRRRRLLSPPRPLPRLPGGNDRFLSSRMNKVKFRCGSRNYYQQQQEQNR